MSLTLADLAPIWSPHEGQRAYLQSEAPIRVLACGRRWGKTDACAAATVLALQRESPSRHVLIAPTLDQANLLFGRIEDLLEALHEHGLTTIRPKVRRTPFPRLTWNGHSVAARSGAVGRSLRGNEASHIVIDEAAFLPESIITEVAMPMLATTNGRMTLISTPRGMNHFWRFYRLGVEGRHGVWSRSAPSRESPHVSAQYLEVQRELISERAYRTEYEAEFLDQEGRVFSTEAVDAALVATLPSMEGDIAMGVDFGKYTDFTAVAVLRGDRLGCQLIHLERFNAQAWSVQLERVAALARAFRPGAVLCDGTGGGDPLVESLGAALPECNVRLYVFTSASKHRLVDDLVWALEQRALAMTPHPELLREMEHFEAQVTPSGNRRLTATQGYHDDLVIALALALQGLSKPYRSSVKLGGTRRFAASPPTRTKDNPIC